MERRPDCTPFACFNFGAPTEEGCVKSFSFSMPYARITVALQIPIPFVGFLFVESLFECVTLRNFHFSFTISFSKN